MSENEFGHPVYSTRLLVVKNEKKGDPVIMKLRNSQGASTTHAPTRTSGARIPRLRPFVESQKNSSDHGNRTANCERQRYAKPHAAPSAMARTRDGWVENVR